jgi:hypothetical protein
VTARPDVHAARPDCGGDSCEDPDCRRLVLGAHRVVELDRQLRETMDAIREMSYATKSHAYVYAEPGTARALAELARAREVQNVRRGSSSGHLLWRDDPNDGVATLGEEFGEVCTEVNELMRARRGGDDELSAQLVRHRTDRLREELIDVGQVVVAWLEALEAP